MPGTVAAQLGTSGLIIMVWIAGGVYGFAGANTYAELGTMLPLAGGPYVYARRAYGDFGGFLVGWSDWLLRAISVAYLAVALSEYSAAFFSYAGWRAKTFTVTRRTSRQSSAGCHRLSSTSATQMAIRWSSSLC